MEGNPSLDISSEDEVHYFTGRLLILDNRQLKQQILDAENVSKVAGHMGQYKTIKLIRRNFFWPEMEKCIKDYVHSCPECQKKDSARHADYSLLQPLELVFRPLNLISMDFFI
jgi:hypothetical protein